MNSMRKIALACMTAAMVTISANAGAQGPANQDTFFTFSQAVELPQTTLPAGTYFFQLMDSPSNRHIVKVMSQDRTKLHATLMAIPYYSTDRPSDEPQVRFLEVPAAAQGTAASNAIRMWFYPGNSVGHEFIWPRDKAISMARSTGEPVLTTKTADENSDLTRVDSAGVDTAVTDERQASTQTAPAATTEVAQAETPQRETVGAISGTDTTPAPTPAPVPERAAAAPAPERTAAAPMPERTEAPEPAPRTDLPNTAGALPLLALIGLGSLAGSRIMRRARR
jgi:hypothetical protein